MLGFPSFIFARRAPTPAFACATFASAVPIVASAAVTAALAWLTSASAWATCASICLTSSTSLGNRQLDQQLICLDRVANVDEHLLNVTGQFRYDRRFFKRFNAARLRCGELERFSHRLASGNAIDCG